MMWLSIASVALGVAGLVHAYLRNRAKASLEKLIKAELRGLAGNVENIRVNPGWADNHLGDIHTAAMALETSDLKERILIAAHKGARDATAAERMLGNLLNELLSLQQGLFETKAITHPNVKPSEGDGNDPQESY